VYDRKLNLLKKLSRNHLFVTFGSIRVNLILNSGQRDIGWSGKIPYGFRLCESNYM